MGLKKRVPIVIASLLLVSMIFIEALTPKAILASHSSTVSTIGGVDINVESRSEIESLLASKIVEWKEHELIIQGTTAEIQIPSEYINFDIKKTIDAYLSLTSKRWYKFWGKTPVIQMPIEVSISEEIDELLKEAPFIYKESTSEKIKEQAGFLLPSPIIPEEVALSKELMDRVSFEIEDIVVDGKGLTLMIEKMNEVTILPGERVSLLEKFEEIQHLYSKETVNFFASVLYSAVLKADTSILERHSQHKLPAYLEPGIEVSVDKQVNQDFIFKNEGDSPILIATSVMDSQLKIELYSLNNNYEIAYSVSNKEIVEPRTIYRLTSDLSAGKERIIERGKAGLRVKVYKKSSEVSGSFEDEELISADFYPPINKVIEVSSLPAPVIENNPANSKSLGDSSKSLQEKESVSEVEGVSKVISPEDVVYDKGGNIIGVKEEGQEQ